MAKSVFPILPKATAMLEKQALAEKAKRAYTAATQEVTDLAGQGEYTAWMQKGFDAYVEHMTAAARIADAEVKEFESWFTPQAKAELRLLLSPPMSRTMVMPAGAKQVIVEVMSNSASAQQDVRGENEKFQQQKGGATGPYEGMLAGTAEDYLRMDAQLGMVRTEGGAPPGKLELAKYIQQQAIKAQVAMQGRGAMTPRTAAGPGSFYSWPDVQRMQREVPRGLMAGEGTRVMLPSAPMVPPAPMQQILRLPPAPAPTVAAPASLMVQRPTLLRPPAPGPALSLINPATAGTAVAGGPPPPAGGVR